MKYKINTLLCVVLVAMTLTACNKTKTCRCAVMGTQDVRIVQIEKGECDQLRVYNYHTPLDVVMVDSLLCTDYEFDIDSIYND